MKHSFAVVGLLLALYSTQPSMAIGGPCDLMFDSAKAMCESGSIKNNCAEINQGIEAFTKLVQAAQSKFCAFPSPIWLLCKYCKASESGSSQLENERNGTAPNCWAAPSGDDLAKLGELERTIKELTSSILTMSAGGAGAGLFERSVGDVLAGREAGNSG
ncbi:GL14704 [Drosophila persimilis]|uniref:GL14704 n=1 Tax=Drosophila persimilis TaxID=7234 RepID=B4GVR1_DROPE|nr:GL14704 [Drosophila persimilis]